MSELIIEWREAGQLRRETIHDQQRSKHPGTVRLGRDPSRCDVVLSDLTVSGLHIEIFFNPHQQFFALRNLRATNPPMVDGQVITQGEARLNLGSTIHLGQVALTVTAVSIVVVNHISPTILIPPPVLGAVNPVNPLTPNIASYGLECPNCHRVSAYDRMDLGCQWCGTSLAAAASVLLMPNGN